MPKPVSRREDMQFGVDKPGDLIAICAGILGILAGILEDEIGAGELLQIAGYNLTKHVLKNPLKIKSLKITNSKISQR